MTILEIWLIIIIWIGYGLFAAYQTKNDDINNTGRYVCYVFCAPVIFIFKCLYGAFKQYEE